MKVSARTASQMAASVLASSHTAKSILPRPARPVARLGVQSEALPAVVAAAMITNPPKTMAYARTVSPMGVSRGTR